MVLTALGKAAWAGPENAEKAGKMLAQIPMYNDFDIICLVTRARISVAFYFMLTLESTC